MDKENKIKEDLLATFPWLGGERGKISIQRERRLWAEMKREDFHAVLNHAYSKLGFTILCTMTGLDEGENLTFIYHVAREDGIILNLRQLAPKSDPVIKTVSGLFPAGHIYEREVIDLLGAKVEGLEPGNRYPLPDGWPDGQYPLRKDWKPEMLKQVSKGGNWHV